MTATGRSEFGQLILDGKSKRLLLGFHRVAGLLIAGAPGPLVFESGSTKFRNEGATEVLEGDLPSFSSFVSGCQIPLAGAGTSPVPWDGGQ
jgi:hypothetical protein